MVSTRKKGGFIITCQQKESQDSFSFAFFKKYKWIKTNIIVWKGGIMEKLFKLSCILLLSICLTACSEQTSQNVDSSSYKVETGDIITISVASEYKQIEEVPFKIYKEDQLICEGSFTSELSTENYLKSVPKEDIVENESINGNEFILIKEDGQCKGFVFVNDANAVITISYQISQEGIVPFMNTMSIVSETKK